MNDLLDIELILKRTNYGRIYQISYLILIILLVLVYILFTYQYQTFYVSKGKINSNKLELLVNTKDLKYFNDNNKINIDNKIYPYEIDHIDKTLYIDEVYDNYQYIYLSIPGLSSIDNYVYDIKLTKKNQILAKYLKDIL